MLVRNFKSLSKKDVAITGGKGASLAKMRQIKIPIPPGFVMLSTAFEKFIEEADIGVEINALWNKLDIKNAENIEINSERMQRIILSKKFPEGWSKDIFREFSRLKTKYVAVRSSATSEDSKSDAWPGQLESYLYVEKKNLLKHIQRCWASLFSPRALFYRVERGLVKDKVSMAVVVQKMINPEVSGVMFTAHPVTRDKNQIVIEAGWGLGEAIVQGTITPDSYIVEKNTLNLVDININSQKRQIVKAKGLNRKKLVPKVKQGKQKLSGKQIKQLADIGINIERHYGFPCDIEWALERNKFYIIQSRPISTSLISIS